MSFFCHTFGGQEDNWTPAQQLDSLPPPWRDFLSSDVATGSFCFREDVLLVGSQV